MHRCNEFFWNHRFEKVIQGTEVNRFNSILIKTGCENNAKLNVRKLFKKLEACHPGHLNIKKNDIWFRFFYRLYPCLWRLAFFQYLYVRTVLVDQHAKSVNAMCFIVNDNSLNHS